MLVILEANQKHPLELPSSRFCVSLCLRAQTTTASIKDATLGSGSTSISSESHPRER